MIVFDHVTKKFGEVIAVNARSDHLRRIKPGPGEPGPTDSWVTLGALARETTTIRGTPGFTSPVLDDPYAVSLVHQVLRAAEVANLAGDHGRD